MNNHTLFLQYNIKAPMPIIKALTYTIADNHEVRIERETTTLKKRMYLEILEKTMGKTSAICNHIDITRGTYYNWLKNDPEFLSSVCNIKSDALNDIEDVVVSAALKGNISAAKFILSKKHPGYKKTDVEKKSTVNIYHHTESKEKVHEETMEDYFVRHDWVGDNKNNTLDL